MRATIICDGSYCPETGAVGYGYWIRSYGKLLKGGGHVDYPIACSIGAEMIAVANSLYHACEGGILEQGVTVLVQTDCVAAIERFQGMDRTLDATMNRAVRYLMHLQSKWGVVINFRHVKGHTIRTDPRYYCNRFCDKTAKTHMREKREQLRKKDVQALPGL